MCSHEYRHGNRTFERWKPKCLSGTSNIPEYIYLNNGSTSAIVIINKVSLGNSPSPKG